MHFVDTMHSEAVAFSCIHLHSDAYDTVRIIQCAYKRIQTQLFCTRELLEREHLVHRVRVGGPEVCPVLLGGDLELATLAAVVRLLLVAAAAARLRCDPVVRVTDVEEGVSR